MVLILIDRDAGFRQKVGQEKGMFFRTRGLEVRPPAKEFAAWWLQTDCAGTSRMDLDGDCIIKLNEFAEFARNWLK